MRKFIEVERKRRRDRALINRRLFYATDRIGQSLHSVGEPELDAGILTLRSPAAPVAGQLLPLEESFLLGDDRGGEPERARADDNQRTKAGSLEANQAPPQLPHMSDVPLPMPSLRMLEAHGTHSAAFRRSHSLRPFTSTSEKPPGRSRPMQVVVYTYLRI
jgi:hypothetical protein